MAQERTRMNLGLPADLRRRTQRWADERGISLTAAIGLLLRAALDADPPKGEEQR